MKHYLLLFSIAFILVFTVTTNTKASHLLAAYITYEYAGTPNRYIVKFHIYGCGGTTSPPYPFICYSSLSLGFSDTISLPIVSGPGNIVSYSYCNGNLIDCVNSGLEEYVCSDTVTLPQAANDWKFQFSQCCRGGSLPINLLPSPLAGMLVTTTLDNLTFPVNSSPDFSDSLVYYYCVNQPSIINYNCVDADGDSMVYSLVPVFDSPNFQCPAQPVQYPYNAGFSPSVPLASSTTIMFDTATGLLAFTPSVLQYAQVGVKIDEYRNGILIGSVQRDDQVRVPDVWTSIDETNFTNDIEVYPNPFNSSFTVKVNTQNFYNIQLLDVTGRLLLSKSIRASETFNMNKLSKGIYIYHIYDDNGNTCIGKLVKN